MPQPKSSSTDVAVSVQQVVQVIRDQQVVLDHDLAALYGVETKRLVEQVKRNIDRFPTDFTFQLSDDEFSALRSQSATSNAGRGGRRRPPYAFTEQGVAMLSSVLRSEQAVAVNIEIMRAFVTMRRAALSEQELVRRLDDLERDMQARLDDHDEKITLALRAIKSLMTPDDKPNRRIGFAPPEEE
jgi:hypothetical protein